MPDYNGAVLDDIRVVNKFLYLKRRCRDKGLEFGLTLTSVRNMLRAKRCAYTGIELTQENMSVDRIDATKGYVVGNVVACDRGFNERKANLSADDIRAVCAFLDRRGI